MLLFNARNKSQGFTIIETLIVILLIGILSALAAPSFLGIFSRNKVNDGLNEVRGALQEAQRAAIRRNMKCRVALTPGNQPKLTSNCFQITDYTIKASAAATSGATAVAVNSLPVAISNGTGLVFSSGATGVVTQSAALGSTSLTLSGGISAAIASGETVAFRTLLPGSDMATNVSGSPRQITFGIRGNTTFTVASSVASPSDTSGKIIVYKSDGSVFDRKCLAISNGIGIIRTGKYSDSINSAANITVGTCNASQ